MRFAGGRVWAGVALVALLLVLAGTLRFQDDLVAGQMTYGNFDIPGRVAFVNRLAPGIPDHASAKVYTFDEIHWHPLIALILVLFPLMLFWGLYKNWEFWRAGLSRVLVQWTTFVVARLGVLRAGQVYPLRRSCLGTFPFLNCQACEMASGACPIGYLQNLLVWGVFPSYLLGLLLIFGLTLGKSICGWLCPFGFFSDLMDRLSFHRWRIPRSLGWVRYWVLVVVLLAPLLYVQAGIRDRNFFCSTICASGKIYGLAPYYGTTGAGSFLPIAGWLGDPLGKGFPVVLQVGLTLLVLVAMLLFAGRIFCRVLCPLGGFWGLFHAVSLVRIRHQDDQCSRCGGCERVCPMGVRREFAGFLDHSSCMVCGRCVTVCQGGARAFTWGFTSPESLEDKGSMIDTATLDYGSLFNRLRRDFYMVSLAIAAKSPLDMARYAFQQTVFYKRLYGSLPQEFTALPLARKRDLGTGDPYDVLSDELRGSVTLYGETTGSTGFPTPVFYTPLEFQAGRLFSKLTPYVGALDQVLAANRAVVNGLTFGFTIAGPTFGDFLGAHGGVVANVGSRSTIATPPRTARAITRLRPSVITGTPIDLLCWMRIIKEDHPQEYPRVLEELKVVLSTAELCAASRSAAIRREFGLIHIDIYACVEGFFSIPCPCGELHILPLYHTEVFDPDLKLIGTYGEGRFAFTNLLKKSAPFVRYLLDDFVTIFPSQCSHGFKRSIQPHGRWELTVQLGGKRLGVRHFEEAIFAHGLFGDYRVILEDTGMKVVIEEYGTHDPVPRIRETLAEKFHQKVEVETVPFGTLTKYREVRVTKPILKVEDKRSVSTQTIPEFL
ncbi:MAG: 4Fe-4S binding protein [Candidatus Riflebacteria bacterium]|nr:4Fe-4S binding protein [Candidatus Riflebacteria bacterium]